MKIKTIDLENWQSHKKTSIELSPGFTVILGPSNSGKSAIIRALSSLLFKEKYYLRNDESSGLVSIETTSGDSLSRAKSIKNNTASEKYDLNGKVFRKIGRQIPEEIIEMTRMKPIVLSDGSLLNLNVQSQHSGKFLLSDTEYGATFRARVTSLTSAETLDAAAIEAAKEHRRVKATLTFATERSLSEVERSLSELSGLKESLAQLKDLKEKKAALDSMVSQWEQLQVLSERYKKAQKVHFEDLRGKRAQLMSLIASLDMLRALVFIRTLKSKEPKKINVPSIVPIEANVRLLSKMRYIGKLGRDVANGESIGVRLRQKQDSLEESYHEYLKEVKQCPLCEGEMTQ